MAKTWCKLYLKWPIKHGKNYWQVTTVETVTGDVIAMTCSWLKPDKPVLYVVSRDSRKKWRVTVVDAITSTRQGLTLIRDVVKTQDVEIMLTANNKYLVFKVSDLYLLTLLSLCAPPQLTGITRSLEGVLSTWLRSDVTELAVNLHW